jgi:hypothetical protein
MALRGKMAQGRWHEAVANALPDGEVVFSTGLGNHEAAIVARLDDGRWLHYSWTYGSCDGCDAWESEMYSDIDGPARVADDIRNGAAIMDSAHFADYLVSIRASKASWLWDNSMDPDTHYPSYEDHVGLTVDQLVDMVSKQ